MMSISGIHTGAIQPTISSERVSETSKVPKLEEETQGCRPVMDRYVPEEKQEPFGRYWMGKDEDGQPKIYFDNPNRAEEDLQEPKSTPNVEKPEGKGVCDTSKVDREIEKLKKKRQELEQRLNRETDETKIEELKRQLTQVERELREKDNDAYRKQHATFTQLS